MFLKRAYLSFSALDHDPKNVMLACIYVAGKVCFLESLLMSTEAS